MNTKLFVTAVAIFCLAASLTACSSDRIEKDEGTVFLSVTDFDGLPTRVSVNSQVGAVIIGEITITNFPKNPNGSTSNLQSVEIDTYEVFYSRADTGTRAPAAMVRPLFGFAPANGTIVYNNLPIVSIDQFENPPLEDLQFQNGGLDKETGSDVITLNLRLTFFGRTVSGDDVQTEPVSFTIEFVQ